MTHAMIFMRELNEKNIFISDTIKNGREHLYCLPFTKKENPHVKVLSYFRVFAKGRLQLLLINTIVLKSPYFKFTHNRERTHIGGSPYSYIHDYSFISLYLCNDTRFFIKCNTVSNHILISIR